MTEKQLKQAALRRRRRWATASDSRGSSTRTTATCAGATAPAASRWTRWAARRASWRCNDPTPGKQLRLSIDLGVQKAGQQALASYGKPGAFVAMDPRNGEVLGLGSNPSFDPNVFAKGVRRRSTSGSRARPTARRSPTARPGPLPDGSAFKLITSTATLESGLITPSTVLFDGGSLTVGGVTFKNAGGLARRARAAAALQVSSDVFFYRLGLRPTRRAAT